ncbi:MAG: DUF4962 domain-containing protein [Firmicutes bacterium]|nr:DUF4962 domain-containing protein [Bacillota bacterium]
MLDVFFVIILVLIVSAIGFAEEETLRPKRPGLDQLGYYPENLELVRVNPPYFLWIPETGAVTYEVELSETADFAEKEVFTDLVHTVMLLHRPLENGKTYYWRYRFIDANGDYSLYSRTRGFTISKTAPEFYVPPHEEIKAKIGDHPRLFVTPNNIEEIRTKIYDPIGAIIWDGLYWDGRAVISKNPGAEPEDFPGGVWEVNHWNKMNNQTVSTMDTLEKAAFVYVITKEEDLGLRAKEWLLEVAKWDPSGPTSARVNDESSMNYIYRLCRAYTWLYDLLSEEDKKIVQETVRIRGEEIYDILTKPGEEYHVSPYLSHSGRQIAFLGEAAIAFLGEIEEADKWFDYVTDVFFSIYPAWGAEDGGWAEGPIYWRWYLERILWFADAYYQATGVSLMNMPFWQNTGYFGLYVHPPYAKHSPFGDNLDKTANIENYYVMSYLAKHTDNPYFKWHADQIKGVMPKGVMGFLWHGTDLEGKAPSDLPQSRYFRDVGWVSMHTDLADGGNNIHLLFKSSPYGSYSHSHADQNAFALEAFGSPLIISSGYYPYYQSPHHWQWTNATISKSTILIDGGGQQIHSFNSTGEISDFVSTEGLDYTLGDATKAYSGRVQNYDRQIIFIKPHYILIRDTIASRRNHTYDWLLHSREPYEIEGNTFKVVDGKAKLVGEIRSSVPLELSSHDKFLVEPEQSSYKNQWHFTAHALEKAGDATFTAILVPQKTNDDATYDAVWEDNAVKVTYKDTETVTLFTESAFGLTLDGLTGVLTKKDGELYSLLISDGTTLKDETNTLIALSRQGSSAITIEGGVVSVSRDPLEEGMTVNVRLTKSPDMVIRDKKPVTTWSYDEVTQLLTIELP